MYGCLWTAESVKVYKNNILEDESTTTKKTIIIDVNGGDEIIVKEELSVTALYSLEFSSSSTISNEEFLSKVSDTMGTTVQDKPSYTIALDTKITSTDRESFAQSIASNLSGTVESTTTETDPDYSWLSITTVVTSTGV